jgi:hypothetical protein
MTEYMIRVKIHPSGVKQTFNERGVLHSFDDEPAVSYADGHKEWWKEWYNDGKRHRDNDKPAIIGYDGSESWYKDGELHRDNDEPAFISSYGTKEYWKNDKRYTPIPKTTTLCDKIVEIDGKKYKLIEV